MWVQERTTEQAEKAKEGVDERPLYLTLLIVGLLVVVGVSIWQSVRRRPSDVKVNPVTVQHQEDKPVSPMRISEQDSQAENASPDDLQAVGEHQTEQGQVLPATDAPASIPPSPPTSQLTAPENDRSSRHKMLPPSNLTLNPDIIKSAPDFLKGLTIKLDRFQIN